MRNGTREARLVPEAFGRKTGFGDPLEALAEFGKGEWKSAKGRRAFEELSEGADPNHRGDRAVYAKF